MTAHALRKPEFSHRREKIQSASQDFCCLLQAFQSGIPLKTPFSRPENLFFSLTDPFSASESAQTDLINSDPAP